MRHDKHSTKAAGQSLSTAPQATTSKWESASRTPSASPATMRQHNEQRSLKSWPCNWSIIQGGAVMSANDATVPRRREDRRDLQTRRSTFFEGGLHVQE